MALTWTLNVDWADSGSYTNESARMVSFKCERGRRDLLAALNGFQPLMIGTATIEMDNYDGRFTPTNSSGALYPNVAPGKRVQITVNDGVTTYAVFLGWLENIIPLGFGQNAKARLVVRDGFYWLKNKKVFYGTQTNISIDTAIGYVLNRVGYTLAPGSTWTFPAFFPMVFGPDTTARDLGASSITLPYWWASGENAKDAIEWLTNSEMGFFFFAADGVATFYPRDYRYTSAVADTITSALVLKDITLQQPWENVRNVITIEGQQMTSAGSNTLWSMATTNTISLGASEMKTQYVKVVQNSGRAQAALTVSGTSITANTKADGTGLDVSSYVTVNAIGYGEQVYLELTNTYYTTMYITALTVSGTTIYRDNFFEVSASEAPANRGSTFTLKWLSQPEQAQDYADWLVSWLKNDAQFPKIKLEDRATYQFARELFDRLTLTLSGVGINADFFIAGIEHSWVRGAQGVQTTWHLEPADTYDSAWVFTATFPMTFAF